MQPNTTKRVFFADLLKGIAVLLMVQVHVMEQFASPAVIESWLGKISLFLGGPACAPVFLILMGYFISRSTWKPLSLVKRGLLLFALGIVLNVTRSANLLIQIWQDNIFLNPFFFIFGVDILILAGLSCMVLPLVALVLKKNFTAYFLLALGLALLSGFVPDIFSENSSGKYIEAFFTGNASWSYFPFLPWFSYVLVGFAFNLLQNSNFKLPELKVANLLFVFLVCMVFVPFAWNVTTDLYGENGYYHHDIRFFLWTIPFMLLYLWFVKLVSDKYNDNYVFQKLVFIGKNVTLFYVIQWVIIGNIATEIYQTQSELGFVIWTLLVLLLSYAATRAVLTLVKRYRENKRVPGWLKKV